MLRRLKMTLPDPEVLLGLPPPELARIVFPIFQKNSSLLHPSNLSHEIHTAPNGYEARYRYNVALAVMEAWHWLLISGLIVPKPGDTSGWHVISRAGQKIENEQDFIDFTKASLLSRALLHPKIADDCWANYIRGSHDIAVFAAFREVEVAVREVGEFSLRHIGVELMRLAFHVEKGPLTDLSLPSAEREALSNLFAGAIGSYKNPTSHRTGTIADVAEAGEMLMLASHLLRIVDDRRRRRSAGKIEEG